MTREMDMIGREGGASESVMRDAEFDAFFGGSASKHPPHRRLTAAFQKALQVRAKRSALQIVIRDLIEAAESTGRERATAGVVIMQYLSEHPLRDATSRSTTLFGTSSSEWLMEYVRGWLSARTSQ